MAKDRINTSDRKVIETQSGALRDPDFRLPEIDIVGYGSSVNQTIPGGDPGSPGQPVDSDISTPYDIQIEKMEVRIQPDGSSVVDLLVSYEAAEGAVSHEVRISRL